MEQRILEIIKKEFDADVLLIERITEGYSHYMYDVKITKNPFDIIIRFSNNIQETKNLGKEKFVIDKLQENNLPAPKILAFYFPQENKKEGYMILEKFKGIRLDTIWEALSKQEKINITIKMGKLLSNIHNIKFDDFGDIKENGEIEKDVAFEFRIMGKKPEHSKFLRKLLINIYKDIARLTSFKLIGPKFISNFVLYLTLNIDLYDHAEAPVLTHGDFMTGHIFVEKINNTYEINGLIDFEFAAAYSPSWDFIKLHRQNFFEDENLKNALIKGYGNINEKAIDILRTARDFGFAWAMLECGNIEKAKEVLQKIEKKINKELKLT